MASDADAQSDADDVPASEPPEPEALPGGDPAPMDFNLFVLSLNASALVHLGDPGAAEPGAGPTVNLPMARQTIDMIALLEEKTRGNLTGEEDRLIHQVLFDLRMRFTDVAKAHAPRRRAGDTTAEKKSEDRTG